MEENKNKEADVIRFDMEGQTVLSTEEPMCQEEIRRDENGEIVACALKKKEQEEKNNSNRLVEAVREKFRSGKLEIHY